MKGTRILMSCLVAVSGLAGSGPALAASKTTALVGLYETGASDALRVDPAIATKLGCDVLRTGKIVAQDGDIGLPKLDAFIMLACSKPVLGASADVLAKLVGNGKKIAFYEGTLVARATHDAGAILGERQYILKVSMFNNMDPAARQRDLGEIDRLVEKRKDRYSLEAAIEVNQALGTARPDEVVVIYYDDGAAGDRFRADNPDIMGLIGQFNSRHVERFIYYVGSAQK